MMPACGCPDKIQEDGSVFSCKCKECSSGDLASCSCNKSTGCSCMSATTKAAGISSPCECAQGTCTCANCPCQGEASTTTVAPTGGCCGGK